ncbi:hypothetical protein [Pseudoxanthomonas sp. PXM02]|uniref:hypothetical protein n=1 Tax=Pseudoxanthomonas sp. PXM02 TaxID=2769294 RepID=UPI001785618C|nr:hypothetical protein [Pseudoxanthomonas sp. PXM02]MBD9479045.1 hypothetical protein [Pseudoxanthomonas sp. PXM02]
MIEFLNTTLTFPTLLYSVLLAFCTVYWLLAATGIVDFDAVDGWLVTDGDGAEPTAIAGMLAKLGLSGVPLMLVLTVLAIFGWLITYFAHLWLLQHLPDTVRWITGAGVLVAALLPGMLVTSVLLRPLASVIARLRPPVLPSVLGRAGAVISPHVDHAGGRAQFDDGGAGLILQVRALPGERFGRGDRVVLIEHLESENTYRVISEAAFQQQ